MSQVKYIWNKEEAQAWFRRTAEDLGFDGVAENSLYRPPSGFPARIEHTLLRCDATDADVKTVCQEALAHGFRSVCCLQKDVALCARMLEGSPVKVVTVVNFPLAGSIGHTVLGECRDVIEAGAEEIDMVVDVRSLLARDPSSVRRGISEVVGVAEHRPVKVILETGYLTPEQIVIGCAAAAVAGAAYVKTSTGYGPRGASVEDVELMRAVLGDRMGIKASGGIRDGAFARQLVAAGADLLGTSSGPELL